MNLSIRAVLDKGDLSKERIVIDVHEDDDVGDYLLIFPTISGRFVMPGGFSDGYWFPDQDVKSGDTVIVYSKSGSDASKKNAKEAMSYFYYWGKRDCLFSDISATCVLVNTESWKRFPVLETVDESTIEPK